LFLIYQNLFDYIGHPLNIEKEKFEPLAESNLKNEEAIFEIIKVNEYKDIIKNVMKNIETYNQDLEPLDDYPYFRVQNLSKFIPKLNSHSEIFSERQLRELHSQFPYYHQYKNLVLLYSTSKDGVSMKTFYNKTAEIKNSIILVKDDEQNVFWSILLGKL